MDTRMNFRETLWSCFWSAAPEQAAWCPPQVMRIHEPKRGARPSSCARGPHRAPHVFVPPIVLVVVLVIAHAVVLDVNCVVTINVNAMFMFMST